MQFARKIRRQADTADDAESALATGVDVRVTMRPIKNFKITTFSGLDQTEQPVVRTARGEVDLSVPPTLHENRIGSLHAAVCRSSDASALHCAVRTP